MYYLNIEDSVISFLTDEIHDITDHEIPITNEEYDDFFERQSEGVQFKLRDEIPEDAKGLFDYVEEMPIVENVSHETLEDLRAEYEMLIQRMQALADKLNV